MRIICFLQMDVLCLELRHTPVADPDDSSEAPHDDVIHDPEWTDDLIQQLSADLGVELSQRREAGTYIWQLKLRQLVAQEHLS